MRDEAAVRAEGQRLFDLAQLDLWASLQSALRLPSVKEPTMNREAIKREVDEEQTIYGDLIKASVRVLIRQDKTGYEAVMASLEELEGTVKAAFPLKPPQTVADIVTLYDNASSIETDFNQVVSMLVA